MTIQEMRRLCQKGKNETSWYARLVTRKISIYVTWLLVKTSITANQVSLFQIIFSWLGCFLLFFGGKYGILWTILFWQIGYLLDCVDGEVARYKKISSITGVFLDSLGHVLIISAMFWTTALFAYFKTNNFTLIILAFVLSMFVISPVKHSLLRALNFLLTKPNVPFYNFENNSVQDNKKVSAKNLFSTFLKAITETPNDMNIFCIVLLVYFFTQNLIILAGLIYFYTFLIIFKEAYFLYSTVKNHQIEREYNKIIEINKKF